MSKAGIIPVGLSVLVLPEQVDEKSEGGIIVATIPELEREQMRQTDGVVIAIGPEAWNDEKAPRCKVGDRIVMIAYAGMIRKGQDGLNYRLVRDTEVIGILEDSENE